MIGTTHTAQQAGTGTGTGTAQIGARPDAERLAEVARRLHPSAYAIPQRVARALDIVLAEWETIPRYNADHADFIGTVSEHAIYIRDGDDDGDEVERCDCLDHHYRGGRCKHLLAVLITEIADAHDRYQTWPPVAPAA